MEISTKVIFKTIEVQLVFGGSENTVIDEVSAQLLLTLSSVGD